MILRREIKRKMENKIFAPSFITSASHLSQCPQADCLEIVVLGRSNVGKSSFINLFMGKNALAKSSSTPGKTRLINFFGAEFIQGEEKIPFKLIDLPGFGYAKVSKEQKKSWEYNLVEFLSKRTSIKLFLHLIDSRHLELNNDLFVSKFLNELIRGDQAILQIYTKADKLKNQAKNSLLAKGKVLTSINPNEAKTTSINTLRSKIIAMALGRGYD